jgi:hypothetical protein
VGSAAVADGVVELQGLLPGEYGLAALWGAGGIYRPGWTTVTVAAGVTTEATLTARPLAAGNLTVHAPEGGADVVPVLPPWLRWQYVNLNYGIAPGTTVLSNLPAGDYRVEADTGSRGRYLADQPRTVTMGDEDQEVTLDHGPPAATLRLTYTAANGDPITPSGLFGVDCERPASDDPWPTSVEAYVSDRTTTLRLAPGAWSCTANSSLYPRERADVFGYATTGPYTLRSGEVTRATSRLRVLR